MNIAQKLFRRACCQAIFCLAFASVEAASQYRLTDLGTLGGNFSSAEALNNLGEVVGTAATAEGDWHAFLFSKGVMHDLGTFGGTESYARGINDAGMVSGSADTAGIDEHAFVYFNGVKTDLGTLGGPYSHALAINSAGKIVGRSYAADARDHAFSYAHGQMEELPVGNGSGAAALAINDHGQVVGSYDPTPNSSSRAFLYSNGVVRDLMASGWSDAFAQSINNSGEVTGSAGVGYDDNRYEVQRAFLFSGGMLHTLGTLGGRSSYGYGINDEGQIVGSAETIFSVPPSGAVEHAFLYAEGEMLDLNELLQPQSDWTVTTASAINRSGQIAASAVAPNGETHAVLLTPEPGTTVPPTSAIVNLSTRGPVGSGDEVLIAGLIITGSENKTLVLRGLGPTLGLGGELDPVLELHDVTGRVLAVNDNWQDAANLQEIIASRLAPQGSSEATILRSFAPGSYTAILRGAKGSAGIGLVEIYDLTKGSRATMANLSTRGRVGLGDDVMISGVIVAGTASQRLVVRALGPSLARAGVVGALADPFLELRDQNGDLLATNDNWQAEQGDEIRATSLAPADPAESAIARTLGPGSYTAIVRGANGAVGIALAEVYALQD